MRRSTLEPDQAIHIVVTPEALWGFILSVGVPTLLFWWRLHALARKSVGMLTHPENHGIGTKGTNALLDQHMRDEADMHRESIASMKYLTHTIRELSYYIRWLGRQQLGKDIPPYIRNSDDPT